MAGNILEIEEQKLARKPRKMPAVTVLSLNIASF